MRIVLCLLLLLATAPAQGVAFDVEKFLARSPVVDGCVNIHSPGSKVGAPDFNRDAQNRSVRAATGVAFGSMTCGTLASIEMQAELARTEWKGVRLVRSRADLDACLKDKAYGLLLYCQNPFRLRGRAPP